MLVITESGIAIYSENIIEIFRDKYRNGTHCIKISLRSVGDRILVSGIDRERADQVLFTLMKAESEGWNVFNCYSKFDEMLKKEAETDETE